MPRSFHRSALCVAAMLLPAPGSAQSRAAGAADSLPRLLGRMFAEVDSLTTPGCVIGVDRRGLPTLYRAWGLAHLETPVPNDTLTVFEAGSVSKQVTATAVMLLAEAGKLSLDDELRRFFPEWPASMPRITIRQLLHHQSGLREWSDLVEVQGWPRGTRAHVQADMVALVMRQRGLNFPPGREYFYSNSNYLLLAELVARISGETFAAYTQRAIFAPLGMAHTQWRDDYTRAVPHRASGFGPDGERRWRLDMPFEDVIGAGGLLTTAPDLLTWLRHLDAPRLGGPTLMAQMETPGVLVTGFTTGYALGLEVDTMAGVRTVTHGGATAGYRAYAGRIPSLGVRVALLCNAAQLNSQDLGEQVMALAGGLVVPAPPPTPALGGAATDAARLRLAGMYVSARTRTPVTIAARAEGITLQSRTALRPAGANSYASEDGTRRIRFDADAPAGPRGFWLFQRRDSSRFDRRAAWTPTATERSALLGRYRSAEAGAEWVISATGDSLRVRSVDGRFSDTLEPIYPGAWGLENEQWLIVERRDARGRVTGFDIGRGRTRTLPFSRVDR